ncbi:MAG TPA: MCP four helix bundle domain-containing protein, partial [Burkholderiaceae bacterium]
MNYKNWKIGTRLGAGFAAVLVLLLVVALVGLNGMSKSDDALRHIVGVNVRKMALLEDMSASIHIESRVIRSVALLDDAEEVKEQSKKIVAAREVYDNAGAQLEKMPLDDAGKAFVAEIGQHQLETRPLNDKFEEMAKSNKDEAVHFLIKTVVPANDKWQHAIKDYIDLQRDKNARDEQAAISAYDEARAILFTATVFAIALGAAIAWLATRSITRP